MYIVKIFANGHFKVIITFSGRTKNCEDFETKICGEKWNKEKYATLWEIKCGNFTAKLEGRNFCAKKKDFCGQNLGNFTA